MNIIADVAGRFDELKLLLEQMPKDEPIVLVGDLMDRGSQSKQVIEWAMTTPNVTAIKGNHDDMMVDFFEGTKKYDDGIWFMNGGDKTIKSYGCLLSTAKASNNERIREKHNPKEHVEWLKNNPIFIKKDGVFISHAPWSPDAELGEIIEYAHLNDSILWNRYPPKKREGVFQIFGHNSSMHQYADYAICIDDCSHKRLAGIHWPTKKIYFQDYLDIKW